MSTQAGLAKRFILQRRTMKKITDGLRAENEALGATLATLRAALTTRAANSGRIHAALVKSGMDTESGSSMDTESGSTQAAEWIASLADRSAAVKRDLADLRSELQTLRAAHAARVANHDADGKALIRALAEVRKTTEQADRTGTDLAEANRQRDLARGLLDTAKADLAVARLQHGDLFASVRYWKEQAVEAVRDSFKQPSIGDTINREMARFGARSFAEADAERARRFQDPETKP